MPARLFFGPRLCFLWADRNCYKSLIATANSICTMLSSRCPSVSSSKKLCIDPVRIMAKCLVVDRGIKICYNEFTDKGRIVAWENKHGKVTDVFFSERTDPTSIRVAQTTGSVWDNFTKPETMCPVENAVFGLHKLLCSIDRIKKLEDESEIDNLKILVPEAVANWVAKKPQLVDDPIAVYCSLYVAPGEPVTDFEQAKANWLSFHEPLVDLLYSTHPSIAKLVIGRKMPFTYFNEPFEKALRTTISSFRAVQLLTDNDEDLCVSFLSHWDEEFSWSDKLYAHEVGPEIKGLGPLCCFKPYSGDDELEAQKAVIREQVEAHMWTEQQPKHKLGKINLAAREITAQVVDETEIHYDALLVEELTACGWTQWVQKHTGQDPFNIKLKADGEMAKWFLEENRFDQLIEAMLEISP